MGLIYKLIIPVAALEQQEIVLAFVNSSNIDALEQSKDSLIIYNESRETLQEFIDSISFLEFINSNEILIEELENQNWNKQWESSFQPIIVDNFCTIRASFHKNIEVKGYEIIIDPELAFGTGHHETTYMMISQMANLELKGKTVFDFGCGTAILAILAKMMGSERTLGIDHDEQSIACAHECLSLNNISGVELKVAEIEQLVEEKFDIILANINRKVLLETGVAIRNRLTERGKLLLSGLLKDDREIVLNYYSECGFELVNEIQKGEWISLLMQEEK